MRTRMLQAAETFDEKYSWSAVFVRREEKRTIYLRNIHRPLSPTSSSSLPQLRRVATREFGTAPVNNRD